MNGVGEIVKFISFLCSREYHEWLIVCSKLKMFSEVNLMLMFLCIFLSWVETKFEMLIKFIEVFIKINKFVIFSTCVLTSKFNKLIWAEMKCSSWKVCSFQMVLCSLSEDWKEWNDKYEIQLFHSSKYMMFAVQKHFKQHLTNFVIQFEWLHHRIT